MVLSIPSLLIQELWKGILVFCRLGSALMVYPGVGEGYVPVRVRLGLAIVCSYLISSVLPTPIGFDQDLSLSSLEPIARELAIGLGSGILIRLLFLTLETIGTIWGMQTGLSHVLMLQPLINQQASLWGHVLVTYALALLFTSNGHHLFMRGLAHSFQTLPLGASLPSESLIMLVQQTGLSCAGLALTLSAPLLGAGLVFYVALGLLNRVMPHVQVFFIIQPLQILLGFLMISLIIVEGLTLFISHVMNLQTMVWFHG